MAKHYAIARDKVTVVKPTQEWLEAKKQKGAQNAPQQPTEMAGKKKAKHRYSS